MSHRAGGAPAVRRHFKKLKKVELTLVCVGSNLFLCSDNKKEKT